MQYRDAYAFFIFLVFIMVTFNYKDYTDRLQKEQSQKKTKILSPIIMGMSSIKDVNRTLYVSQNDAIASCANKIVSPGHHGDHTVIEYDNLDIDSFVVDVRLENIRGIKEFLLKYKPRKYIVLEPLQEHFLQLQTDLRSHSNVLLYNFGLATKDDIVRNPLSPPATSVQELNTKNIMHMVNAKDFFVHLGVGFFQVDLLILDASEFQRQIMDAILKTTLVFEFKLIQINSPNGSQITSDSARLFCQHIELLSSTHTILKSSQTLQLWIRKDLIQEK